MMRGESLLDIVTAFSVATDAETRLPSPSDVPSLPWQDLVQVLQRLPTIRELQAQPTRVHARLKTAEAVDLLGFTCDPLDGAFNTLGTVLFPWEKADGRRALPFALMDLGGKTCAMTLDDFDAALSEDRSDKDRHVFVLTIIDAELVSSLS